MLDCSRNGVMKPSQVKHYVDLLVKMGYNTLMLYTEDTYEIESQPYFGHLRGRFTKEELSQHMEYMKRSDRVFKEVLGGITGAESECIPLPGNDQSFQFFDNHHVNVQESFSILYQHRSVALSTLFTANVFQIFFNIYCLQSI